jgi:small-conductance mechanosensitive channel
MVWERLTRKFSFLQSTDISNELLVIAIVLFMMVFLSYWLRGHMEDLKRVIRLGEVFQPLYMPTLSITIFAVAYAISQNFLGHTPLLFILLNISFIWLIASIASVCTKSEAIVRTITYIVTFIFILNVFGVLDQTVKHLDAVAINVGTFRVSIYLVIKSIISLIILLWVTKITLHSGIKKIRNISGLKYTKKELLVKIFEVSIYFAFFMIFLRVAGISLTAFAVIGGALSFGIGFGLQKIALNLISGIILLVEDSIKENDILEMHNGVCGIVKSMSARYILLKTFTGKEMLIPNEAFIVNEVTNWTYTDKQVRLSIKFAVSYRTDIKLAQQIIIDACEGYEYTVQDREVRCFVHEFSDSAIVLKLWFWVDDIYEHRKGRVRSDVMLLVWDKFREHDIEMPYPQRVVHVKKQNDHFGELKAKKDKKTKDKRKKINIRKMQPSGV